MVTNEKTPTLEELEAALRHYESYSAAIESVKDEREKHVWKIKNALRKYLIDEQVLEGMVFEVSEEYKEKVKLRYDSPKIPLVSMLDEHFSFKSWYLMTFKRDNDEYENAVMQINRWSITITLPDGITKEEIKQLKEKFGFTIDTCDYVDRICRARDRIKYFEEKLELYG
jgi:hypothetical protein